MESWRELKRIKEVERSKYRYRYGSKSGRRKNRMDQIDGGPSEGGGGSLDVCF